MVNPKVVHPLLHQRKYYDYCIGRAEHMLFHKRHYMTIFLSSLKLISHVMQ